VTVLVACISCVLAVSIGVFVRDLAHASITRVRAQIAADAAALAAVAESAPYGHGDARRAATAFAELNGARLLDCTCDPGATAVQVTVAAHGVAAEARAVLDVALLAPQPITFEHGGLHPRLATSVERLVAAADGSVWVVSGYRSPAEQAALWRSALARYGKPEAADDWVAPPGRSLHEKGLAVDLGGDLERAAALVGAMHLPLHRPLDNEPWHFELTGSRD
jgi:hypothetical protein